jgi:indolepyruvate decarboxylase
MLGTILTDVDTGIFTHNLDERRLIVVNSEQVRVRRNHFQDVLLGDFLKGLSRAELPGFGHAPPERPQPFAGGWKPVPDAPVTVKRLFQKLNAILDRDTMVLADPGDALFAAADLTVHQDAEFLASSFYATLGWAVPAAIGAQLARPDRRPIVLVGDGAFQMTGTELGTTRRGGLNPIVVVMNNKGYLTERFLMEGRFNDVPDWCYHRLPEFLGTGRGFEVRTEAELESALTAALADRSQFTILNVHLDPGDTSPALRRLAEALSKRV